MNDSKLNILFMGSGEVACPTLDRLLQGPDRVVAVVTQPERPKGRNRKVAPCAVKAFADESRVPVLTPEKVGAEGSIQEIEAFKPDLIVVAAYGQYIKPEILDLPRLGAINFHPSLLPKYRGAAPMQMALANGDEVTGVTILYVAEKMDAGDMILQREFRPDPEDTVRTLSPKLAELGAEMIMEVIDLLRTGAAKPIPQDDEQATYVKKLSKEDGRVDWRLSAETIRNRLRGFTPWPGCTCEAPAGSGKMLRIHRVAIEDGEGEPGAILSLDGAGPLVATGEGGLRLVEVQPAGKKSMPGDAWLRGRPLGPDDRMG